MIRNTTYAAILVSAAQLGLTAVVRAQAKPQAPTIDVSLSEDRPMAGAPLSVHVKMTNPSDNEVHIRRYRPQVVQKENQWISFELQGRDGETITAAGRGAHRPPVQQQLEWHLGPSQAAEMNIPAGAFVTPPNAGNYVLIVRTKLRFAYMKAGDGPSDYSPLEVTRRIAFTATIEDDKALRAYAALLSDRIRSQRESYESKDRAIIQLVAVRASVALPIWRSLIEDSMLDRTVRVRFIVQLSRLNSAVAANLLAECWATAIDDDDARVARNTLLELHQDGSPLLRSQIERIFVQREGKFTRLLQDPKVIVDPGGTDKP